MSAETELHDAICNAVIILNNGEEIAPEVSAILRTALAEYNPAPPAVDARELQQAQPRNEWKEAVINELIVAHVYQKEHETNPRKAIQDAITWNCQVALDPAVSSDARALVERGLQQAQVVGEKPSAAWQQAYKEIAATPLSEIKGDLYQAVKKRSEEIEAATPQSSAPVVGDNVAAHNALWCKVASDYLPPWQWNRVNDRVKVIERESALTGRG